MGPSDDLKPAVMTLGDGRATLDPVAAIDVAKAVLVVHGCSVDVAADDTLGPMVSGFGRQRLLERADIVHCVFDLQLRPFGERPVRRAQNSAHALKMRLAVRANS